tara:strand:- start:1976 stop:2995 length:1020 start_codon:yes stop_codon:yes gene_type:complete
MDDFVISNLHESRNEWCSRLVSIFTPLVSEGVKSIFNESWNICIDNEETNKYLMTFQNLLSRVPKWNNSIIEEERKRIIERSGCNYLEDLISCVHIIQLKVLTCIRVGNKQKKIDISIPNLDAFIHKVYINVARKVYMNVYLFEKNVPHLQTQKNNRELEVIIQECIMMAIRESIPTEAIIRAYMDEGIEQDEQVIIENIEDQEEEEVNKTTQRPNDDEDANQDESKEDVVPEVVPSIQNMDSEEVITKLSFNDMDSVLEGDNHVNEVDAPKTIERLEDISTTRAIQRKLDEEESEDDERIQISTEKVDINDFVILDEPSSQIFTDDVLLNDIEELPSI